MKDVWDDRLRNLIGNGRKEQVKQMDDMNSKTIVSSRKPVYATAVGLVILFTLLLFGGGLSLFGIDQSDDASNIELAAGSPEKFAFLSGKDGRRSVGST